MSIMKRMEGITISEMAEKLKLPKDTIRRRLLRAGCKPFTQEALYTIDDFNAIKYSAGKGRPKNPKKQPPTPL